MTRGRHPKKAIAEAHECARRRGGILEIPDTSGLPFDLLFISLSCITFVKVMRMRARLQGPPDAFVQFGLVIRDLRKVPESAVAVIELWVLSSHKTWQYFRVMPDRIVEIRSDGSTVDVTPVNGKTIADLPSVIAVAGQNAAGNIIVPLNHSGIPAQDDLMPRDKIPGFSRKKS